MASRDRKRTERQKRKARSAERRAEMAQRTEAKNEAAREALQPLETGERPPVLTVGAVLAGGIAILSIAGFALWDVLRSDPRPNALAVASFSILIGAMAIGLWRARYWAAMGFQATLVLLALEAALGIVGATSVLQLIGSLVLITVAGTLFFLMIKAMARIQMPERPTRE